MGLCPLAFKGGNPFNPSVRLPDCLFDGLTSALRSRYVALVELTVDSELVPLRLTMIEISTSLPTLIPKTEMKAFSSPLVVEISSYLSRGYMYLYMCELGCAIVLGYRL